MIRSTIHTMCAALALVAIMPHATRGQEPERVREPGKAFQRHGPVTTFLDEHLKPDADREPADPDPARFEDDVRAFENADAETPPTPGGVLFYGSSSFRLWNLDAAFPGVGAVNRGFGGSQYSDALHFLDRIVLPHRPKLLLIYEGDNDIKAGKAPERIRDDFAKLVRRVRAELPETRIAVLSIKPSPDRWPLWDQATTANLMIARLCAEDDRLIYVDVATPLLGPDGQPRPEFYREDGIHLNEAGYRPWSQRLRPILNAQGFDPPDNRASR